MGCKGTDEGCVFGENSISEHYDSLRRDFTKLALGGLLFTGLGLSGEALVNYERGRDYSQTTIQKSEPLRLFSGGIKYLGMGIGGLSALLAAGAHLGYRNNKREV